jgi:hypothetical protein
VAAQGKSRPKVRTEGGVPAASRVGFGRDDLSIAAELEERVRELRRTRELYPGMAVFRRNYEFENAATDGRNAQTAAIRRPLCEGGKSTLSCPLRSAL